MMNPALPPDYDLKEEIVRMLHPKWHLLRAYYLVVDMGISHQEVGRILARCAGSRWPKKDQAYHPNTVRNYVLKGRIEARYFKGPLWRLSPVTRGYLEKALRVSLEDDRAIELVQAFVGMYSVRPRPRGCGPKIWKDIVDAIE